MKSFTFPLFPRFEYAVKPPNVQDYPKLTSDLLGWGVSNEDKLTNELWTQRSHFMATGSKKGGRVGLLKAVGERDKPNRFFQSIIENLDSTVMAVKRATLSLFLTQIPQFTILNLFNTLGHTTLEVVNKHEIKFKLNSTSNSIEGSHLIQTGMKILGIGMKGKVDYTPVLVKWSQDLELMNTSYTASRNAYPIILNRSGKFLHNLDDGEDIFQYLKRGLEKLVKNTEYA
ncbi:MAG: hypothetical protein ACTSRU_20310 [Candidatus Hodarchaeales archaeon]